MFSNREGAQIYINENKNIQRLLVSFQIMFTPIKYMHECSSLVPAQHFTSFKGHYIIRRMQPGVIEKNSAVMHGATKSP